MTRLTQTGSHVIGLALLLLVVGVIGFTGYTVVHRNHDNAASTLADTKLSVPKAIKTKQDLSVTAHSLDAAAGDLNSNLDGSTLDSTMNDLL